jgi:hypothetical protein
MGKIFLVEKCNWHCQNHILMQRVCFLKRGVGVFLDFLYLILYLIFFLFLFGFSGEVR